MLAKELTEEADELEKKEKYSLALKKYQQSYKLHKVYAVSEKIERLKNIVEAEKRSYCFCKNDYFKSS